MARADWLSTGDLADVDRAIQMEPADSNLLTMAAVYRSNTGDQSAPVDQALKRARQLNPLDSRLPMELGLRAEFRGDVASAESLLRQAVELDRQFKPAWTLANFYYRHGSPEKALPLLRHCLELDPLGYDPNPVFELCWNIEPNAAAILQLVPRRDPILVQYLAYLVRTHRVSAAAAVWPRAIDLADPASGDSVGPLSPLPALLLHDGNAREAFDVWNRLVGRGMVKAERMDPAHGLTLADPSFSHALTVQPFGWSSPEIPGVITSETDRGYRFELDGNQPESFEMLATVGAVVPSTNYRLRWETIGDDLSAPDDPGFVFLVSTTGAPEPATCQVLGAHKAEGCVFRTGEAAHTATLTLAYHRAPGTVRPHGVLRLQRASLEAAK